MKKISEQGIEEPTIIQKGESANLSMTYHMVMMILELFLAFRTFWNLFSTFMNGYSVYRTIDQVFYVLLLLTVAVSIWKHDHRTGVFAILGFGIIDLIFQNIVLIAANMHGIAVPDLWLQYLWFALIAVWEIATVLYYRKRWSILK
jgi:hypothetical protein